MIVLLITVVSLFTSGVAIALSQERDIFNPEDPKDDLTMGVVAVLLGLVMWSTLTAIQILIQIAHILVPWA